MKTERIEKLLKKYAKKTKNLQFALQVPALGLEYDYSSTIPGQRFHSASIGKLMTAVVVFKAIEEGRLALDSKVRTILEPGLLEGLFVAEGTDYQGEVTVEQLLGHLSGINDYFESETFDGASFVSEVLENPDVFWTPGALLDFTRRRQKAVARPGEVFFYSDTGYVLLGLVVEAVYGLPFHKVLEGVVFEPCGMGDSAFCFYGEGFDQEALAPLVINGVDVHLFRSLSCDFSGGGVSTTGRDLLNFLSCLQGGRLLGRESLDRMAGFGPRYRRGLYYGLGMMEVRFGEFFFLLKGLPSLWGHLGVSGVHAWFDPRTGACFVLNVGNTRDMVLSFRLLISIVQLVGRG